MSFIYQIYHRGSWISPTPSRFCSKHHSPLHNTSLSLFYNPFTQFVKEVTRCFPLLSICLVSVIFSTSLSSLWVTFLVLLFRFSLSLHHCSIYSFYDILNIRMQNNNTVTSSFLVFEQILQHSRYIGDNILYINSDLFSIDIFLYLSLLFFFCRRPLSYYAPLAAYIISLHWLRHSQYDAQTWVSFIYKLPNLNIFNKCLSFVLVWTPITMRSSDSGKNILGRISSVYYWMKKWKKSLTGERTSG